MGNALFDKGREAFLAGDADWDTDDIRIALLSAGYTPNLATHDFVDDLGANIVARSGALTGKTATAGVADHAAKTILGVSGAEITRLAYYKYNASDAAARLICLIDTADNLPMLPNNGDITVTADVGANKLFKL